MTVRPRASWSPYTTVHTAATSQVTRGGGACIETRSTSAMRASCVWPPGRWASTASSARTSFSGPWGSTKERRPTA